MESASLVARLVADEVPGTEVSQRLLDLRGCVHHERAVAGDRLVKRSRRGEEKPAPTWSGRGLDHVSITENDQGGRANGSLLRPEADFALVEVGERGVAPRHHLAERAAGWQRHIDEFRGDGKAFHRPDRPPLRRVTGDDPNRRALV